MTRDEFMHLMGLHGMVRIDAFTQFGACPECGAAEGQQCSIETAPGEGMELAGWAHEERLDELGDADEEEDL